MKRLILTLALVLLPCGAYAQDHTADVAQAKADLQAAGVNLSGSCGAVKIANLVAWRLRPGYGLLHKAGGNRAVLKADGSCLTGEQSNDPEGYATDYLIVASTGVGYDLLSDGGGANGPQWAGPEDGPDMVARNFANYREAIDPSGYLQPVVALPPVVVVPPPVPLPNPPQPIVTVDLSGVINQEAVDHAAEMAVLQEIRTQVNVLKAEVEEFQTQVRSKYVAVMDSPIVRYGLAAVTGWLLTKAANK